MILRVLQTRSLRALSYGYWATCRAQVSLASGALYVRQRHLIPKVSLTSMLTPMAAQVAHLKSFIVLVKSDNALCVWTVTLFLRDCPTQTGHCTSQVDKEFLLWVPLATIPHLCGHPLYAMQKRSHRNAISVKGVTQEVNCCTRSWLLYVYSQMC